MYFLLFSPDGGPEGDRHPSTAYLLPPASLESSLEEGVTSAAPDPLPSRETLETLEESLPPALPDKVSIQHTLALRKGLPSLKQLNSARRQLRPLATPTTLQRLGSPASATTKPREPGDPEQPTAPAPLQITPFTMALATTLPHSPQPAQAPDDSSPGSPLDKGDNELTGSASEESQETTTSTIITTTIITTEQAPGI